MTKQLKDLIDDETLKSLALPAHWEVSETDRLLALVDAYRLNPLIRREICLFFDRPDMIEQVQS